MMDDGQASTTTNSPLPQSLPPQSPSGLEAVSEPVASDPELGELDGELNAQINDGETDNTQQLRAEPEGTKAEDGMVQGDNTLKDEQGWDQIMTDDVDNVVPATDAVANAAIIAEHAQDTTIAVDPELSANGMRNSSTNVQSFPVQAQNQPSSTDVGSNPLSTISVAQPYTLPENRGIGPVPPLSQSRLDALPIGPGFAPPRNHHGHPINLPPFPGHHAPPLQHQYTSQTPLRQQEVTLQPLMPLFSGSAQSTPVRHDREESSGTDFKGLKIVPDPPDLQEWRERLFNVEDTIVLSEEEFQTYFPHIDNVYSHRSTQRYKRKPFISHYWDCRLKGRPPGTPKSADPNKKKRKRTARERNLCDVKIKITEYFPGAMTMPPELDMGITTLANAVEGLPGAQGGNGSAGAQPFGVLTPSTMLPENHPGASGAKYYTIQRVNGNGGNGRSDTAGGPHRHTLEESDRIKKNSVQRFLMKEEKEQKKTLAQQQKTYHKKASGYACLTVNKHRRESNLKLYGSCFCPFVQRVWIALEVKGIPYQYIEVDPYKKPDSLLEVNPRGLVPAIRHGNWGCHESTVLLEYLEDLGAGNALLPPEPQRRADSRLWADHINRHIIPAFYRLLQEQDSQKQIEYTEELKNDITKLVDAADVPGPFFQGRNISFVDIQFAPWMLRLSRVLKPYRGWPDPEKGSRWAAWVDAVEANDQVMATTSSDELYLDSYERYAENRPDTSMLANAINSGRPLP